jgi:hypothetical protein
MKQIKLNPMQNKKAQLTVFIILGLFILIGTGVFMYFTSEVYKYRNLPEQFIPVAKYVEQCAEDVTLQGIFQAGMNAGYLYPPDDATFLDAGFPVIYWYQNGQDRSVSITHLEKDLEEYLAENIEDCISNFEPFASQFDFREAEEQNTSVNVDISKNIVQVDLFLPVIISDGTSSASLPELRKEVKNSIGNKLFLAYQIMKTENQDGFLEFYTDEIIAASDWLPYEGMDFTCAPKRWKVSDMKQYIQTAVAVNLPFIMFEGTKYEETDDPYYDNIYKVNIGASGVSDLSVETTYNPRWGMALDVQPNNNGIVTDVKLVGDTIALPCIHTYHHKYTTEYPVLFAITDEDSADYPFFFATPVIMKRNEPDRFNQMRPWPSETDTIRSREYCEKTTTATEYSLSSDGSITTEETEVDKWLYSLDVVAMDSVYGFDEILDNVTISYHCVQFECTIGSTKIGGGDEDSIVGYPILSSTFPSCSNGILVAEKEGYQTKKIYQTVAEETDDATVLVSMYKLHPLETEVTVIQNHNGVISERAVEEDEMAVITIKNDAEDFEKIVIYPEQEEEEKTVAAGRAAVGEFDKVVLMVADDLIYEVDIKLIDTAENRFTGSFVYNWTPNANAITAAATVQFYVIKKDILVPTDENYHEAMTYAESESSNYPPELS